MTSVPYDDYRVDPANFAGLESIDQNANGGFTKDDAKPIFKALNKRVEELQEHLYAHGKEKLLFVLQATDTGGKDGTIRACLLYTSPSPRDATLSRMPSSA